MSCNGCRVLRKGCSESCILRRCLQSIESAEAQGHATVFVAKFFGRAGLMSFISAVPEQQRSALFQSLLYEACGRTVNPVSGAVGLLWTGNWHVCQTAVETVLRGGTLRALSEIPSVVLMPESDETSVAEEQSTYRVEKVQDPYRSSKSFSKRKGFQGELAISKASKPFNLDLSLTSGFPAKTQAVGTHRPENRRPATPSFNSEGSVTTCFETAGDQVSEERMLLNLFL